MPASQGITPQVVQGYTSEFIRPLSFLYGLSSLGATEPQHHEPWARGQLYCAAPGRFTLPFAATSGEIVSSLASDLKSLKLELRLIEPPHHRRGRKTPGRHPRYRDTQLYTRCRAEGDLFEVTQKKIESIQTFHTFRCSPLGGGGYIQYLRAQVSYAYRYYRTIGSVACKTMEVAESSPRTSR